MKRSGPSELGVVMRQGGLIRRPAASSHKSSVDAVPMQTSALTTKIFIKGLNIQAECGVYAHEKGKKRPLIIDIEVTVNGDVRSDTDDLAQTIDYDTLAGHVSDVVNEAHLNLIETIAERICAKVLSDTRIQTVRIRIEKPGSVPGAICSGVEIERGRL